MMKKYEIGLYEKAMRNTLSWSEKLKCAKECGYDYMEMCIDATDEKINRIFMNTAEKKEIMEAVFQAGLPIGSMSVSALHVTPSTIFCQVFNSLFGAGSPLGIIPDTLVSMLFATFA